LVHQRPGGRNQPLECEQGGVEVFRSLLTMIIRNGRITGGRRRSALTERKNSFRGAEPLIRTAYFASVIFFYAGDYSLRANCSGTLNESGGTLTGTQVLGRLTTGDGGTRTCRGTFLKVELPRQ
jgi:hypothetical protein